MKLSRRDFLRLSALGLGSALVTACGLDKAVLTPDSTAVSTRTPLAPTQIRPFPTATSPSEILHGMGFAAFAGKVKTYQDAQYLYVESDGMPSHPMMIGITSWQQQVPLPQFYIGNNAWRIPLNPVIAENPISAQTNLYRGAIALAVNGVPIFNALNNRGDDAYLAGELDEWGGHAGRADDYHYHVAPLHLQELVGVGSPIAYALDGFPIYGSTEPDGSPMAELDQFNGHFDANGSYHYHGTNTYPYINGGMRGVVTVQNEQIEPQPRTTPIRPYLQPLKGAVITDFQELGDGAYSLEYTRNGQKAYVNYRVTDNTYIFEFLDAAGNKTTETYTTQ
ncbi:MAG: YHYH protein [Ardenticatenaceae bacterium]|nr:YHYH protein [Ardenticatenaceae bacterium]